MNESGGDERPRYCATLNALTANLKMCGQDLLLRRGRHHKATDLVHAAIIVNPQWCQHHNVVSALKIDWR